MSKTPNIKTVKKGNQYFHEYSNGSDFVKVGINDDGNLLLESSTGDTAITDGSSQNDSFEPFVPTSITLDQLSTFYSTYQMVGNTVISNPTNTYGLGASFTVRINGDGNDLTVGSQFDLVESDLVDDVAADGTTYILMGNWDGYKYVTVIKISEFDMSAPVITSATVENGTEDILTIVFDRVVTIANLNSLSLDFTTGTAKTLVRVSGSNTNTLEFTLSSEVDGNDVFTFEATANNTIRNKYGNTLGAVSRAVINNINIPTILTFDTTLGDGVDQITLLLRIGYTYDFDLNWGDGTIDNITTYNQTELTHDYATGGEKTVTITGTMQGIRFRNLGDKDKLTAIQFGKTGLATDQTEAFYGCSNLSSLSGNFDELNAITIGANTFRACALTSIHDSITLPFLTDGSYMFYDNDITTHSLVCSSLVTGTSMLGLNSLTTIETMELGNLVHATNMFFSSNITSISGHDLSNVEEGVGMFFNNNITAASGVVFSSLTDGTSLFFGSTNIINTTDYSNILINTEATNTETDVPFHGGASKYNTAGGVARAALEARTPGWTITDGGAE